MLLTYNHTIYIILYRQHWYQHHNWLAIWRSLDDSWKLQNVMQSSHPRAIKKKQFMNNTHYTILDVLMSRLVTYSTIMFLLIMFFFLAILNFNVLIKLMQSWLKKMCSATKKVILYTSVFRKERQEMYFAKQGTRISQITYTLSIQMSSHCLHISNYMYGERRMWELFNHFRKG